MPQANSSTAPKSPPPAPPSPPSPKPTSAPPTPSLSKPPHTWAIVELLAPHVARVVVSNPLTTQAIACAKIKTDKIDARVLADLLRCDYLPSVWQPDPATRRLRRLCARRAALCADRTALKNRLHATLAMQLIVPPTSASGPPLDLFSTKGLAWLRALVNDPSVEADTRAALAADLRLLDAVQQELDTLDQLLARLGYSESKVKLLMSLPGVDYPTALALLAAWGDIRRFPDAAHATSYLGLAPSTRQSDAHCYHGPITKRGASHTRWMLCQAAQHCDKHPGPLGGQFRRLAHKKNRNVAVVACARKLALIAWQMLRHNEPYRYALPVATEATLSRLRVQAGGLRRKTGTCPGPKSVSRSGDGGRTRTIKPLARVYELEGLPALSTVKPAESRVLAEMGVRRFVADLAREHIVARPVNPKPVLAE